MIIHLTTVCKISHQVYIDLFATAEAVFALRVLYSKET